MKLTKLQTLSMKYNYDIKERVAKKFTKMEKIQPKLSGQESYENAFFILIYVNQNPFDYDYERF
jgi:hypothetical protein